MHRLIPDTPQLIIIGIGYLMMLASWSWLVHIAFQESAKHGLLFILIPFYSAYYIITRWSKTMTATLIHMIGWIICLIPL